MKKNKKKKAIFKMIAGILVVAGVGYLAYKKIPQVKNFVNGISEKETPPTDKKSFRKYEIYKKK